MSPTTLNEEALMSVAQAAADIQRLALLVGLKGRASDDRVRDIMAHANRINVLAQRLHD